jgi:hypothetical protein
MAMAKTMDIPTVLRKPKALIVLLRSSPINETSIQGPAYLVQTGLCLPHPLQQSQQNSPEKAGPETRSPEIISEKVCPVNSRKFRWLFPCLRAS